MFERPFRGHPPSQHSRAAALAAFEPLVGSGQHRRSATASMPGGDPLTLWAAVHGLVHLELQGYFAAERSTESRVAEIVIGLLDHACRVRVP